MTDEESLLELSDKAAGKLAERLVRLRSQVSERLSKADAVSIESLSFEERTRVEALFKCYEQLFDLSSRQLMRAVLIALQEKIQGIAAIDAYNRLESLGAIEDANLWKDMGTLRNRLTHAYPLEPEKQALAFNEALGRSFDLLNAVAHLRRFVRQRGILKGVLT